MMTIFDDIIYEKHLRDKDISRVISYWRQMVSQDENLMAQIQSKDYLKRVDSGEDIKTVVNEFLDLIRLQVRLNELNEEIIDYTKMRINEIDPITEKDVVGICPLCGKNGVVWYYPEGNWVHTAHVVKSGRGFVMTESYHSCSPENGEWKSYSYRKMIGE